MRIKAGATLVLETGEYSDYTFHGPFRVLRDFDQAEAVEQHKAAWRCDPEKSWDDKPDTNSFIGWLNREGMIEDIPGVVSWHIGNYMSLEPEIAIEPKS
jgi:hypothetical protein